MPAHPQKENHDRLLKLAWTNTSRAQLYPTEEVKMTPRPLDPADKAAIFEWERQHPTHRWVVGVGPVPR